MPRPIHYCTDARVIGTDFYLMEHVDGRIFVDPNLPGLNPDEREIVYEQMMTVLARLHEFDPSKISLGNYGKTSGNYYERQIKTWAM